MGVMSLAVINAAFCLGFKAYISETNMRSKVKKGCWASFCVVSFYITEQY